MNFFLAGTRGRDVPYHLAGVLFFFRPSFIAPWTLPGKSGEGYDKLYYLADVRRGLKSSVEYDYKFVLDKVCRELQSSHLCTGVSNTIEMTGQCRESLNLMGPSSNDPVACD